MEIKITDAGLETEIHCPFCGWTLLLQMGEGFRMLGGCACLPLVCVHCHGGDRFVGMFSVTSGYLLRLYRGMSITLMKGETLDGLEGSDEKNRHG